MTTLPELHEPEMQFINPDIDAKVKALLSELEALPGVSVALFVRDAQGRVPSAFTGDAKAMAIHLARMLPGLLISTGLRAEVQCDCQDCRRKREAGAVRA